MKSDNDSSGETICKCTSAEAAAENSTLEGSVSVSKNRFKLK